MLCVDERTDFDRSQSSVCAGQSDFGSCLVSIDVVGPALLCAMAPNALALNP